MNNQVSEWKLMHEDAISDKDRQLMCSFIMSKQKLSYGEKVKQFESIWSDWLGCKHSVYVNSGSSANLLLVQAAHDLYGHGNWVAQSCTWATNITPIIQLNDDSHGLFLTDVDLTNLGPSLSDVERFFQTQNIKYLFLTHVLGMPAVNEKLLELCKKYNVMLFEDCCESHGSSVLGKKVGTFGKASTFSFFYGHHITTVEGGMICTDDTDFYHHLLLLRSHGMLRELPADQREKRKVLGIDERFTFLCPGYNVRNTDLHAVLGISQMERLPEAIRIRERNFKIYLESIDKTKYHAEFDSNGVSLFSFPIITKKPDVNHIKKILSDNKIDNRPLIAGNLFRHPMMEKVNTMRNDKNANFVHDNGLYVGNSEFVTEQDVKRLTDILNKI